MIDIKQKMEEQEKIFSASEYPDDKALREAFARGFAYGVNQFKHEIWHSIDEVPEVEKEIIVDFGKDYFGIHTYYHNDNTKSHFLQKGVKRWCYIDDLTTLKEDNL